MIAENPSKFTYHGTGTYIVGGDEHGRGDVVVIDPGPKLDSHRDALSAALEGCAVRAILVTHCHADHSPLAAWLAAESERRRSPSVRTATTSGTSAMIPSSDEPDEDSTLGRSPRRPSRTSPSSRSRPTVTRPDVVASTGDLVAAADGWVITGLHTPGHTSNHLCFALDDGDVRTLFTGDHVMGWSTTVVSPPDGDMAAYLDSLRMVAGRHDDVAIPTHGPPIPIRPSSSTN